MFNHTKLAKRPKQFLSITGLTVPQFDSLSKDIQKHYKKTETKRLSKNRKREIGAGRKFDHSIKDRILMFMMYYLQLILKSSNTSELMQGKQIQDSYHISSRI